MSYGQHWIIELRIRDLKLTLNGVIYVLNLKWRYLCIEYFIGSRVASAHRRSSARERGAFSFGRSQRKAQNHPTHPTKHGSGAHFPFSSPLPLLSFPISRGEGQLKLSPTENCVRQISVVKFVSLKFKLFLQKTGN